MVAKFLLKPNPNLEPPRTPCLFFRVFPCDSVARFLPLPLPRSSFLSFLRVPRVLRGSRFSWSKCSTKMVWEQTTIF